jgi:hypothetical protein
LSKDWSQTEDLSTQIEKTIRTHRLPGLEALPDHFVLPNYEGYSIANLPATIAKLFGVELPGAAPPLLGRHEWSDLTEGVRRVILIILDAAGYSHFQRHLSEGNSLFRRFAEAGRVIPLTSVFPSTTVVALTTLWTGHTPIEHGFIGTKMLLREQGVLANMLHLSPAMHGRSEELLDWGLDPETFVTTPSLADRLSAAGVETVAHTRASFLKSGLTKIFLRGMGDVKGYIGLSDLWINLRNTLTQHTSADKPLFVSAYWDNIDATGHVYGPGNEYIPTTMKHLAHSLEEIFWNSLSAKAREDTLLLITADHGVISTPSEQVVHLPDHPEIQQALLLPPGGESRASYLYAAPGKLGALRDYVAENLADRFTLLETEQALESGLFGPEEPTPAIRARLGNLLLIAQGNSRITFRARNEKKKSTLRGHHGSMTPEEMLVPLLMVRLDAASSLHRAIWAISPACG